VAVAWGLLTLRFMPHTVEIEASTSTFGTARNAVPENRLHPIRATYLRMVATLPEALQPAALTLPYRLGLSAHPDGGWEDYTRLEALYDLPLFVAPLVKSMPARALARFRRAHHCAGFYGLVLDRLGDRQATPDPELMRLCAHLRTWWRSTLADALGNAGSADQIICSAIARWRRALCRERVALAGRELSIPEYAALIVDKTRWLAATSAAMLYRYGASENITGFLRCYDLMLVGFQCRDDAMDHGEDRARNLRSFADALDVPPTGLFLAARVLIEHSAAGARLANLDTLANWLSQHASRPFHVHVAGDPILGSFAAMMLSSEILAALA
jgi:hypothetical protein